MPAWITKKLPISQWGAIQFRMEMAQQELRLPLHLAMLVSRGALDQPDDDVFILVPDDALKARFPGFSEIAEHDIPANLKMLVGTESAFAKRFPEIAAKLRTAA